MRQGTAGAGATAASTGTGKATTSARTGTATGAAAGAGDAVSCAPLGDSAGSAGELELIAVSALRPPGVELTSLADHAPRARLAASPLREPQSRAILCTIGSSSETPRRHDETK